MFPPPAASLQLTLDRSLISGAVMCYDELSWMT